MVQWPEEAPEKSATACLLKFESDKSLKSQDYDIFELKALLHHYAVLIAEGMVRLSEANIHFLDSGNGDRTRDFSCGKKTPYILSHRSVFNAVASESALRSEGTLLSRVRVPPPTPWSGGGPESLSSPYCELTIYKHLYFNLDCQSSLVWFEIRV
ncbi:hypothetical protein PoB_003749200 [Plakobranchus ocellatus]|uniref:Uncharacterized protein n=1 Tax=Plakobranchus ocellatus TaxID=259542 RepID=A0AAV4AUI8_9GAST|nr:hypothetical protein PoB_003749200 [Plakobranchus ocellatus]